MNSNRILSVFTGVLLAFLGRTVLVKGGFYGYTYGRYFEFGRLRWLVGGLLMLSGLVLTWTGISPRSRYSRTSSTMVCPKCERPYDARERQMMTCETCKVRLEPVEGFYDRHPELKKPGDGQVPSSV